jgi:hypothetical protein|tara:strand:- start:1032 stop:1181 length:150 start_codon:yes stop_codon:yes gene_type:complete
MPVYIGGIDPIKILETLINQMVKNKLITKKQAIRIIKSGQKPRKEIYEN